MQNTNKHTYIFVVICVQLFLYCFNIQAQNFADKTYYLVDSLQLETLSIKEQKLIRKSLDEYHNTTIDSLKYNAVQEITKTSKSTKVWFKYNEWLLGVLELGDYENRELAGTAFATKGRYYLIKGSYDEAISFYVKSLEFKKKVGNKLKIAEVYRALGMAYKRNGDFINALSSYNNSLKILKDEGARKDEGQLLNTIGYLYMNFGMHSKALECFHKSLKIRDEIDDKLGASYCFNNIASIHKKQGRSDIALEYYHKSLKIREELKNDKAISVSLNNIGVVYKNEKQFDKALEYYQKSLTIKEKIKDEKGISHVLNNIGRIYKEKGELRKALDKYEESLKMTTALHDERWMVITLSNMGELYLEEGNLEEAKMCALKGLKLGHKVGHPELIRDASETLKKVYSSQHDWKKAFDMQDLYVTMRDSIRNKKTETDATEQRVTYEVEKREQEIKLLSVQNDVLLREKEVQQLKINKNRIVNIMFLVGGIVAFILAIFFYVVLKKSRTVNSLLQKQDDEKKVMLKEIHHRVKNNLQVVNSLLRLQSKEIQDKEIVAKFKETQKRIITIAALHEKMYRSENLKHVNLKDHIESIVEDLVSTYAIDKEIDVNMHIDDIRIGLRTLVPLGLIINEIIINSLKYAFLTTDEGRINLQIEQFENGTFEMFIGDNGVGLQSHQRTSGLGSKLINIFTKQLNGELEILEVPGTTYKIVFESIDPK